MENKYNGMFSISPVKRIFYNDKTGETTTYNIDERQILDIRNENIYDTKGKLIKEETQEKYNTLFLLSFDRTHVLYIKKFLDYQFEKTPIKEDFINYLEYGIYPNQIIKGGIKSLMADWIKDKKALLKNIPQPIETKTDKLKLNFVKYGFFELPKVKQLSDTNKQNLIELICANDTPYKIAMIDYLDFLKHLKTQYFKTGTKLNSNIAEWFGVDERSIKGNISILEPYSNENEKRYTANQQKKIVINDYEKLK